MLSETQFHRHVGSQSGLWEPEKTIHTHWQGIINYTEAKISNGILEGINSKIQLAKRRARGFRHVTNFIHMIYFIAGDLKFDYPLDST